MMDDLPTNGLRYTRWCTAHRLLYTLEYDDCPLCEAARRNALLQRRQEPVSGAPWRNRVQERTAA